jgi:MerR family transcriptional regulator, thiopeptide resistance regulator
MDEQISPVIPFLQYANLTACADWLPRVFGFTLVGIDPDPAGRPMMAVFQHGNGLIFARQDADAAPLTGGRVYIYVDDVEEHYEHSRSHGAEVTAPVNAPWGDRVYNAFDLQGHPWTFATPIEDT